MVMRRLWTTLKTLRSHDFLDNCFSGGRGERLKQYLERHREHMQQLLEHYSPGHLLSSCHAPAERRRYYLVRCSVARRVRNRGSDSVTD